MAMSPNFVFTDPVAAQQAVTYAQIAAAEDEARGRALAHTLNALSNQNVARENASQQRAITASQMAQRDRELAQNQSQFDISQKYRDKALSENVALGKADIEARTNSAKQVRDLAVDDELFRALEGEVSSSNPPTDLEFEARAMNLTPQRKSILDRIRLGTIGELNRQADVAENSAKLWQQKLSSAGNTPEDARKRQAVLDAFEKSKDKNYVQLTPDGTFVPLIRRPRRDPQQGPGPGGNAPLSINDLRNRVRGLSGAAPLVQPIISPQMEVDQSAAFAVPISELGSPLTRTATTPPMPPTNWLSTDAPPVTMMENPGRLIPQSQIVGPGFNVPSAPRRIGTGDLRVAEASIPSPIQRSRPIDLYLNDPEAYIPRFRFEMSPAQKAEMMRWLQANQHADHTRIAAVADMIVNQRRP